MVKHLRRTMTSEVVIGQGKDENKEIGQNCGVRKWTISRLEITMSAKQCTTNVIASVN
jgi:hypothetical protein